MTTADRDFLAATLLTGVDGCLMVQAFEPAISNGEYSLVFAASEHTHTMLKVPVKGDFRCQVEFGGDVIEIGESKIPKKAKDTAERVVQWINKGLGPLVYCRIDGIMREDGEFVLMELEAIEPDLWLETVSDSRATDLLCRAILDSNRR